MVVKLSVIRQNILIVYLPLSLFYVQVFKGTLGLQPGESALFINGLHIDLDVQDIFRSAERICHLVFYSYYTSIHKWLSGSLCQSTLRAGGYTVDDISTAVFNLRVLLSVLLSSGFNYSDSGEFEARNLPPDVSV